MSTLARAASHSQLSGAQYTTTTGRVQLRKMTRRANDPVRCQDTYADVGATAAVDLTARPWLDAVTDAGWLAAVTPALLPQSCGRADQSSIEDATTRSTDKA